MSRQADVWKKQKNFLRDLQKAVICTILYVNMINGGMPFLKNTGVKATAFTLKIFSNAEEQIAAYCSQMLLP